MSLALPNSQEALWNVALTCASMRSHRACKYKWDSPVCSQCEMYIKNYVNATPMQAQLYQFNADSQNATATAGGNGYRIVLGILIIIMILCGLKHRQWISLHCYTPDNVKMEVMETTNYIKNNLYDVNNSGEVDCVDYAFMFYQYYPLSQVKIYVNYNEKTKMNHAFNAVLVGDTWKTIEPQSTNPKKIFMEDVWGKQYDSSLDENWTERCAYKQVVRHKDKAWVGWFYVAGGFVVLWVFIEVMGWVYCNKEIK